MNSVTGPIAQDISLPAAAYELCIPPFGPVLDLAIQPDVTEQFEPFGSAKNGPQGGNALESESALWLAISHGEVFYGTQHVPPFLDRLNPVILHSTDCHRAIQAFWKHPLQL
jgi:hypothetical protein